MVKRAGKGETNERGQVRETKQKYQFKADISDGQRSVTTPYVETYNSVSLHNL